MKLFVYDTETTGLPISKILNPDTLHLWPHIVQLSYVIYDTDTKSIITYKDIIVKVNSIPEESTKIHGITNEISLNKGKTIGEVINIFFNDIQNVDMIIGHNISFDINMIKIELLRLIYENTNTVTTDCISKYKSNLHLLTNFKNIYCTLRETIELCDLKAFNKQNKIYLKYPKLSDLHQKLFNTIPTNLHNSFYDVLITLRCYIKMKYNEDLNTNCDTFIQLQNFTI